MTDKEIEQYIEAFFEANYEDLRHEAGHPLRPEMRDAAKHQVLMYWRKLRDIASTVTDTEVPLHLPARKTPNGKKYSLVGVVDIVRTADKNYIYDIKSQDRDAVNAARDKYAEQLNVYAHIWKNLRGQNVDGVAVIATVLPPSLSRAIAVKDEKTIAEYLDKWSPLIEIPIDASTVEQTMCNFDAIVDNIEDGKFSAPPVKQLEKIEKGVGHGDERFGSKICRFCDGRFSCDSYREYARKNAKAKDKKAISVFFYDERTQEEKEQEFSGTIDVPGRIDER